MTQRFRIIDADGHVMEPRGMWERYIDPAFRERAPRVARRSGGHFRTYVDGRPMPRVDGPDSVSLAMQAAFSARIGEYPAACRQGQYSPDSQVKALDDGGIEISFLYPSQGLYTAAADDLDPALAIARDARRGDLFVIEGLDKPIPMGLVAKAGKRAEELAMFGARFEEMHRGGWDPEARLGDVVVAEPYGLERP